MEESLASGWLRLGGHLVDDVLVSVAFSIGTALGEELIGGALFLLWFLVVARRGQSPGKQIVHTRVVLADGRPSGLFRTFVRRELLLFAFLVAMVLTLGIAGVAICFLVFAVGGLWCLFDVNNQCLWDKIARTYVVATEGYERQVAFSSSPPTIADNLERLQDLHQRGLLTDEEYQERRAREVERL